METLILFSNSRYEINSPIPDKNYLKNSYKMLYVLYRKRVKYTKRIFKNIF